MAWPRSRRKNQGYIVMTPERNISARDAILRSIREHLAASTPHDVIRTATSEAMAHPEPALPPSNGSSLSLVEIFKERLEGVGGHCVVAGSDSDVVVSLAQIISDLQGTSLRARRIALSNAPILERLIRQVQIETDEIVVCPNTAELFGYDVGISTAQAAIAETGTLVLESESERHRLVSLVASIIAICTGGTSETRRCLSDSDSSTKVPVSLVPPVHIAIIEATSICLT